MILLLGALRVLWPYLLGALVLGVAYYKANHWCNAACTKAEARAESAEATLTTVKAREAALALKWAAQVDKTEAATVAAGKARNETFDALAGRAGLIPNRAPVRLSADANRVFRDASENANAARPPAVDQKPAATVPPAAEITEAALATWAVEAARAYADAYGHWQACVTFYTELRNGQD